MTVYFVPSSHKMWAIALVSILLQIFSAVGQTATELTQVGNKTSSAENLKADVSDVTEESKFGSILNEMMDWASSATEFVKEDSRTLEEIRPTEEGRKVKYRKTELKFLMRTLIILKIVLGLVLPLGIIASKILSWKAVTLSLMAFMLAKILFLKNLLTGKNSFSGTPSNFVPPVFIQGGPNDLFWKRQGDVQNAYPWNST